MWEKFSSFVLRQRYPILAALILLTIFFGYHAKNVKMSYKMAQVLPETDSTLQVFESFKQKFGQEGSIMVIGIKDPKLYELDNFNKWLNLSKELKTVEGVDKVLSIRSIFKLEKNTKEKKFEPELIFKKLPKTQLELDTMLKEVYDLPFFEGFIYSEDHLSTLMGLTIDTKYLDSKDRGDLMDSILIKVKAFEQNTGINVHYSGLPYIRSNNTTKVSAEIKEFILLAIIITSIILLLFFRSFKAMFFSMVVVLVGVVWAVGIQVLLGFKISILTGLIPPLLIVIGIPNCIFIINKYHQEFKRHGNKVLSLKRVIVKIGNAIILTNTTTSLGFATFIFTDSTILVEFGIVATLGIISVFIISITLMPIVLSFLAEPKKRHVKHLDRKWVHSAVAHIVTIITGYRKVVFAITILIVIAAIYGASLIKTTGNIADDLPRDSPVYLDLQFFEHNFNGVLPFELTIDTKNKGGALKLYNLKKVDELQDVIKAHKQFSKPLSIVEGLKFLKQSYYGGNPTRYQLFNRQEQSFIAPYLRSNDSTSSKMLSSYLDSNKQILRITAQVADVGSTQMEKILNDLKVEIDSIFPPDKYNVNYTGTSVVWLTGTEYLVHNLFLSLSIAIVLIAFIMAMLFYSARMVVVSLVPNLLPLIFTAGVMGYFGISLKPSTILIFSIAFGISVDDTIHYLAKYRQELSKHSLNLREACLLALKETGVSMIYTSIVLFFGFGVFTASDFGGTKALGMLVSITLLIAMVSNLILLPSLLLAFDKWLTTKAFKSEPLLEILDEEEDIDLEELEIKHSPKD